MKKIKNKNVVVSMLAVFLVSVIGIGSAMASPNHNDGATTNMNSNSGMMMHDFESGQEFGQHVKTHAQDMGFSGTHNPGVHHKGFSPWSR